MNATKAQIQVFVGQVGGKVMVRAKRIQNFPMLSFMLYVSSPG
jgi:hypothetical protein